MKQAGFGIFICGLALTLAAASPAQCKDNDPVKFTIDLDRSSGGRCETNADCKNNQTCFRHAKDSGMCLKFSAAELSKDITVVQMTSGGAKEVLIRGKSEEANDVVITTTPDGKFTVMYQEPDENDLYAVQPVPADDAASLREKKIPENGRYTETFENGHLKAEVSFRKGRMQGQYKVYYPNGRIKLFEYYREGRREGLARYYYPNGKLQSEGMFADGRQEDPFKLYYGDGTHYADINLKDGRIQTPPLSP